jgi:hypothetical protein
MRRFGVFLLLSVGLLVMRSQATPTSYKIQFTTTFGTAPSSGSFTYDPSTGFSAFLVQWDGVTFDLTSAANAPVQFGSTGCNSEGSTPQYGFIIMAQLATGCNVSYSWGAQSTPPPPNASFSFQLFNNTAAADEIFLATNSGRNAAFGGGTWRLSAVPEPSTLGYVLFGGLSILARWSAKRM